MHIQSHRLLYILLVNFSEIQITANKTSTHSLFTPTLSSLHAMVLSFISTFIPETVQQMESCGGQNQ